MEVEFQEAPQTLTHLPAKLSALDTSRLVAAEAVYQFEIGGPAGGILSIDISGGAARVEAGENPKRESLYAYPLKH